MNKIFMSLAIFPLIAWAQPEETDVISVATGACYGTCPVFNLMLFSDGTLIFNGKAHVQKTGVVRKVVPKDIFIKAIELTEKYHFHKFKDAYYSKDEGGCKEEWTDHPSKTISVQYNGKIKTVFHYLGCRGFPREQNLIELERHLYTLLNVENLVGM